MIVRTAPEGSGNAEFDKPLTGAAVYPGDIP